MRAPSFDIVIPTVGRPSLVRVLERLARGTGPLPGRAVVVDALPVNASGKVLKYELRERV